MSRILVTGASGFVGKALVSRFLKEGHDIRTVSRVSLGEIDSETDWRKALEGVEIILHLAACVHVFGTKAFDPAASFLRVNRDGTKRLAEEAVRAGVRRLVYVSSVKAMGEEGRDSNPLTEQDVPRPSTPYGISKLEAERVLMELGVRTGLECTILRPPLVYGPGVKGNFRSLLEVCRCGLPLPLKAIQNRRSFVFLGNLVDAVMLCATHEAAIGKTFLIHDGAALSTPDLVRNIADSFGRPARLFSVPSRVLDILARLLDRKEAWNRLSGSLHVEDQLLRETTGWYPRFTMEQGLEQTARWFQREISPSAPVLAASPYEPARPHCAHPSFPLPRHDKFRQFVD